MVATTVRKGPTAHGHAQRLGARLHILHARWAREPETAQHLARLASGLGGGVPVVVAEDAVLLVPERMGEGANESLLVAARKSGSA